MRPFPESLVCSGSHYCIQLCAISLSMAAVFVCCRRLLCGEISVLKNKLLSLQPSKLLI